MIGIVQRAAHFQQPLGGVPALAQVHVEIAVREIGRQDIELAVPACDDGFGQQAFSGNQFLRRRMPVRFTLQQVGCGALRIQVPQQGGPSAGRG